MNCWKCRKIINETPIKIGFRAACSHCDCDLHVCKNCRYYAPGKPNDCLVPGTEFIRDREAANLCEEYKPLITTAKQPLPKSDAKTKFNSLFKDESQ